MSTNPTPLPPHTGQVFRADDGALFLYVRVERRPGASKEQHMFIGVRNRMVYERWTEVEDPLPEPVELIFDPKASARAVDLERRLVEAERKCVALLEVIRQAVPLVPTITANAMRTAYGEAMAAA